MRPGRDQEWVLPMRGGAKDETNNNSTMNETSLCMTRSGGVYLGLRERKERGIM